MKRILLVLLALLATFSVSRFIFEPAHLYHEFAYLDIPMHVLGGYLVGLFFSSYALLRKRSITPSGYFLLVLLMMLAWEVYEYARGVILYDKVSDYFDTLQDFIFGYLGSLFAYNKKK